MILLDTHTVIWLAEAPELLSASATDAIKAERRSGLLAVSDMTLLELARIITRGRVQVSTTLDSFLRTVEASFRVLPITSAIAQRTMFLSTGYPKDPVDRVVGATALIHGTKLITKDAGIRASGEVDCVW